MWDTLADFIRLAVAASVGGIIAGAMAAIIITLGEDLWEYVKSNFGR